MKKCESLQLEACLGWDILLLWYLSFCKNMQFLKNTKWQCLSKHILLSLYVCFLFLFCLQTGPLHFFYFYCLCSFQPLKPYKLVINMAFKIAYFIFNCVSAYMNTAVHSNQRHWVPYNYKMLWAPCSQGRELMSPARVVHALNFWTTYPALLEPPFLVVWLKLSPMQPLEFHLWLGKCFHLISLFY